MIPQSANPFTVVVNGRRYSYPAGKTVEVPAEVAEVIEAYEAMRDVPISPNASGSGLVSGVPVAVISSRWNPDKVADESFLEVGSCAALRNAIQSGQFPEALYKRGEGNCLERCIEVYDFGVGDGVRVTFHENSFLINEDNTVSYWEPL